MEKTKIADLKKKILARYEIYQLGTGRLKRLIRYPIKTIKYYIMAALAYIRPYKVHEKTLWGDDMTYFLPEGNAIFYYGFFEINLLMFILNFLNEGDIFFDIGAHVGYYSLLCSRLVGPSGQVHSFEPTPRTFATLKDNVGKCHNVFANNCALLDQNKDLDFVDYGPKYSAFNSFKNRTGEGLKFLEKEKRYLKVKARILDDYIREKNIVPGFIKIDAEGAEYLVLGGMKDILNKKQSILSIEVAGGEEWHDDHKKSYDILCACGYTPYEINNKGFLIKCKPLDEIIFDNIIFVPTDNLQLARGLFI